MTIRAPRRVLLDTSVVIDFPAAQVAEIADEVAVSAVTIGELQYGVTSTVDPLAQMYRRRRVQAILDRFEVLPFDVITAEHYAVLATLVRRCGRNRRPRRMPTDATDERLQPRVGRGSAYGVATVQRRSGAPPMPRSRVTSVVSRSSARAT